MSHKKCVMAILSRGRWRDLGFFWNSFADLTIVAVVLNVAIPIFADLTFFAVVLHCSTTAKNVRSAKIVTQSAKSLPPPLPAHRSAPHRIAPHRIAEIFNKTNVAKE